jgi:hypothetical protein
MLPFANIWHFQVKPNVVLNKALNKVLQMKNRRNKFKFKNELLGKQKK